jgi:hypothetical protein
VELERLEAQIDASRSSSPIPPITLSEKHIPVAHSSFFTTATEDSPHVAEVTQISAPSEQIVASEISSQHSGDADAMDEHFKMPAEEEPRKPTAVRDLAQHPPRIAIPPKTPSIDESLFSSMRTAISSAESALAQQASQMEIWRTQTDQTMSTLGLEVQKCADFTSSLRDQLNEVRRGMNDQSTAVHSLESAASSQSAFFQTRLESLDMAVIRLSDQLDASTGRADSIANEAKSTVDRVATLGDQTSQFSIEIAGIKAHMDGLKKDSAREKEATSAEFAKLNEAVTTLSMKLSDIDSAQNDFSSRQTVLDVNLAELQSLAHSVASLTQQVKEFRSQLPLLITSKVNELVEEKLNSLLASRAAAGDSPDSTPPVAPATVSTERFVDRSMYAEKGPSSEASFNASTDQPGEDSHKDAELPPCCFILSGMDPIVAKKVEKALESLGATVWTDPASFPTQVTHVCSPPTSYTVPAVLNSRKRKY